MTRKRYLVTAIALAAVLLAATATPTPAAEDDKRCAKPCFKRLTATWKTARWATPQRFAEHVTVSISVFRGKFRLPRKLYGGGCRGVWRGRGVKVVVRVCGRGAVPIRVTYHSRVSGPPKRERPFVIGYEAHY